jgi:hypothetical protein
LTGHTRAGGIAALVKAANPSFTPAQIEARLISGTKLTAGVKPDAAQATG